MKKMNYFILVLTMIFSLSSFSYAESQFGVLKIIASQDTAKIYIDGNFEGTGTVSRDKIIIGNHLVQVKDENKNVLFEEMVSVREGEQTTVVAKTEQGAKQSTEITPPIMEQTKPSPSEIPSQYQFPKYQNVLGLETTYGNWTVNIAGYLIQSSEPLKEVGLYLKTITENNAFAKSSVHYIFPVSGATTNIGTFIGLDIGGQSDLIETSIGANYLFPSTSGTTGGLGYQAFIGLKVASAAIGAKYLVLNGTVSGTSYSYSQTLLGVSIDFGI